MKSFLAIVRKGQPLQPRQVEKIIDLAAPGFLVSQGDHRKAHALSPTGKLLLACWDNDAQGGPDRELITTLDGAEVAVMGYATGDGIEDFWSNASIARAVVANPDGVDRFGGIFAIVAADSRTDTLTVWNTMTRTVPVFWSETRDEFIVSSRAMVVSMLRNRSQTPEIDLGAAAVLLARGYFMNEQTAFTGVIPLPMNSRAVFAPSGVELRSQDNYDQTCGTEPMSAKAIDELAELLVESAQPVGKSSPGLSLSGGIDSRLVAATLSAAGKHFTASSSGSPDHPDVIVAGMVTEALGVKQRRSDISRQQDEVDYLSIDPVQRARTTLFASDGMLFTGQISSFNSCFESGKVVLDGSGGESLRGGFAAYWKPVDLLPENLDRYLQGRFDDLANLIAPVPLLDHLQFCLDWEQEELARYPVDVILDRCYLQFRSGRWGAAGKASFTNTDRVYPLLDNRVTKASMRLQTRDKTGDLLAFELTKRLAPQLAEIPLANKRWKFEQEKRFAEAKRLHQVATTPVKSKPGSRSTFNWNTTWTTCLFDTFEQQIFSNTESQLFDLVDYRRTRRWFLNRRDQEPSNTHSITAWALFSLSLLADGSWLTSRDDFAPIRIPLPPVDHIS